MNPKVHALPLAALFLLALGLRLWGIDFGLPQKTEDDCMIPYQVEALYDTEAEDLTGERNFNWYPLLLARICALWPEPVAAAPDAPLAEHLTAAKQLHVRTRGTLAAIACLAVPLTWLLARLFLGAGWSYLAATLVATSLLHFSFSQQARPHAPSSALFLAAVLVGCWVRRTPDGARRLWLPHAAAALTAFAAVGVLQSGLLCLLPLLLGYLLRSGRRLLDWRMGAPLLGGAVAIGSLYPFLWSSAFGQRDDQPQVFDLGGHMIFLDQFNGQGFAVLARTFWSYDPTLLVLAALALLLLAARVGVPTAADGRAATDGRRKDAWIAASFWLPYLIVFGLYERNYERFMIALVPYAAVLAALGLRRLHRAGGIPGPVLAAIALALPGVASVKLAAVRAAPDTLEQAATFVANNVPLASPVLMTSKVDLPLARTVAGLEYPNWGAELPSDRRFWFLPWSHYLGRLAAADGPGATPGLLEPGLGQDGRHDLRWLPVNPAAYLENASGFIAKQGADYAVAEVFADGRQKDVGQALTDGFRAAGTLLVRFSPDGRDDYSEHPFGYQDETSVPNPHFTARVLQARCTGPVIEVFELDPGPETDSQ